MGEPGSESLLVFTWNKNGVAAASGAWRRQSVLARVAHAHVPIHVPTRAPSHPRALTRILAAAYVVVRAHGARRWSSSRRPCQSVSLREAAERACARLLSTCTRLHRLETEAPYFFSCFPVSRQSRPPQRRPRRLAMMTWIRRAPWMPHSAPTSRTPATSGSSSGCVLGVCMFCC